MHTRQAPHKLDHSSVSGSQLRAPQRPSEKPYTMTCALLGAVSLVDQESGLSPSRPRKRRPSSLYSLSHLFFAGFIVVLLMGARCVSASRVRLSEFTLKISPTDHEFSIYEAKDIRDEAEMLVEDFFSEYNWGIGVSYVYAGLASVRNITWNAEEAYNIVLFKGGVVAFSEDTAEAPSKDSIQQMVDHLLAPRGGESSELLVALQNLDKFSYVEEVAYEAMEVQPPTEDWINPAQATPSPLSDESDSSNTPLILGAIAGGTTFLIFIVFFSYRHRQRRAFWREDISHAYPKEDLESNIFNNGLRSKDSLNADVSDAASSRSSRLGRLLAVAVQRGGTHVLSSNRSNETPPSCSDESSEDDQFSDFGGEQTVTVEPIIVPIGQVESFEDQRKRPTIQKDILTTRPNKDGYTDWRNIKDFPSVRPETVLMPTDTSVAALQIPAAPHLGRWSDVSSQASGEARSDGFMPDELWDFDDNDNTEMAVHDVFHSPKQVHSGDQEELLSTSTGTYRLQKISTGDAPSDKRHASSSHTPPVLT